MKLKEILNLLNLSCYKRSVLLIRWGDEGLGGSGRTPAPLIVKAKVPFSVVSQCPTERDFPHPMERDFEPAPAEVCELPRRSFASQGICAASLPVS